MSCASEASGSSCGWLDGLPYRLACCDTWRQWWDARHLLSCRPGIRLVAGAEPGMPRLDPTAPMRSRCFGTCVLVAELAPAAAADVERRIHARVTPGRRPDIPSANMASGALSGVVHGFIQPDFGCSNEVSPVRRPDPSKRPAIAACAQTRTRLDAALPGIGVR